MIRLVIVESQPRVARGLRLLLGAEADLVIVGEVADSGSALSAVRRLWPDVVLMDIDCPRFDWQASGGALHDIVHHASVILLTLVDNAQTNHYARQAGVAAVVNKALPANVLLSTIRQVGRQA